MYNIPEITHRYYIGLRRLGMSVTLSYLPEASVTKNRKKMFYHIHTKCQCHKTFFFSLSEIKGLNKLEFGVPRKPFPPNLIFVGKARSEPLQGELLALLANIRLCWKGLQGTNTLMTYCIARRCVFAIAGCRAISKRHFSLQHKSQRSVASFMKHFLNECTECRTYVIVCNTMGLKREHDIWYGEVKPFELDEY